MNEEVIIFQKKTIDFKKIEIIFSDIDDTILPQGATNLDYLRDVLKQKKQYFVLCSGRPPLAVERISKMLMLHDNYSIAFNGIIITYNEKIIYNNYLKKDSLEKITNFLNNNNLTYIYWVNNNLYCNILNDKVIAYCQLSKIKPIIKPIDSTMINKKINKIIIIDNPKILSNYKNKLTNICQDINIFTSQAHYLEILNKKVSKAEALLYLCNYLNIDKSKAIAFGDANNDLEMLQVAAIGVVVSNAQENVKKNADLIIDLCNNHSVARFIDKYL